MQTALTAALKDVELEAKDGVAVALARTYARTIDADAKALWRLGPRLLEVLIQLRMTPAARAAVVKEAQSDGGGSDPIEDALDALTREHANRSR
ncbi:MAG: terminase small subunit [Acidimicrobiales bacterium]